MLPGEDSLEFLLVGGRGQNVEGRLGLGVGFRVPLGQDLDQHTDLFQPVVDILPEFDLGDQAVAFPQDLGRLLVVIPEAGVGGDFFQFVYAFLLGRQLKDASGGCRTSPRGSSSVAWYSLCMSFSR